MRSLKRRLLVILICTLVSTQLSGCSMEDIPIIGRIFTAAENIASGAQSKDLKNTVAEDNLFSMNKKTKKAQDKALKAQDKASDLADRAANVTLASYVWPGNWFIKTRAQSAATKAGSAINTYESAKASDTTFLKDRESKGIIGDITITQWRKFAVPIAMLICLLLFLLFRFLHSKKKMQKAEMRAMKQHSKAEIKAAKHADTVVMAPVQQAALVDRNTNKSIAQCKKYCNKFGLDYDTMLAQYGGDPQALLDVLVTSRKEDFQ